MKKLTALLACLALVLLCACGSKAPAAPTDASQTPAAGTEESPRSGKVLVAYFSATGHTERVAGDIAAAAGGDLFAIVPAQPYSADDLDYNDPDNVLYSYFSRRAQEGNSVGMTDEWVFNMLDDARREVDSEKRLEMYQEIEKYLVDNVCFIPIFQPQLTVIIQPNISNYTPAWNGWTSTCYYGIEKN